MKQVNKTTWTLILIGVCAVIALLMIFGLSRTARAASMDMAEGGSSVQESSIKEQKDV